jgi:hypothetical protein
MKLKQLAAATAATALTLPFAAFAAEGAAPSAGDLSAMVPDASTILTAVASVAVVMIGIKLAITGYRIVKGLIGR